MRAVGQPLIIEEVRLAAPRAGEVLIDLAAAGLCHSDLKFLDGSFEHPLPAVLGHEAAGVVTAVGEGVTRVAPGDHVVTSLSVFCGDCPACARGRTHLCTGKEATRRTPGESPRLSLDGAEVAQFLDLSSFAEQSLVHENAVVKVDDGLPLDRAALLGCGVATGLGAIFNTAKVKPGDSVAVIGCGGVGLSAVQGARLAGADRIIAVDPVAEKLDLALALGATDVMNSSDEDPVLAIGRITSGVGVDHAIEAYGSVTTAEEAFAMLGRGGTATIVGLIPPGSTLSIPSDNLFYERTIQGSFMGSNDFTVDIPRYVEMYVDGDLLLDELVTSEISLDEINQGFDQMRRGKSVRSLIVFDR